MTWIAYKRPRPWTTTLKGPPSSDQLITDIGDAVEGICEALGNPTAPRWVPYFPDWTSRNANIPSPTAGTLSVVAGRLQVNTNNTIHGWRDVYRRAGGRWSTSGQSVPSGGEFTQITWTAEGEDSDGFGSAGMIQAVIPAGMGGLYSCSVTIQGIGATGVVSLVAGGEWADNPASPKSGFASASLTLPLSDGHTVVARVWHNGGSTIQISGNLYVFKVGP